MADASHSQANLSSSFADDQRVVSPRPSAPSSATFNSSLDPLAPSAAVASPAAAAAPAPAAMISFPNAPPSLPLTGFSQLQQQLGSPLRASMSPAAAATAAASAHSAHSDRADREPEESKAYSRLGARSSLFGDHSSEDELDVDAPGSEVEAESDEPRAGASRVAAEMDPLGALQQQQSPPARSIPQSQQVPPSAARSAYRAPSEHNQLAAFTHSSSRGGAGLVSLGSENGQSSNESSPVPAQRGRALGARRSASPERILSPLADPASSSSAAAAAAAVPPLAASFMPPVPAAAPSVSSSASAASATASRGPSVVDSARESLEARIVVYPTNEAILRDLSDFVCSICSFLAWKPVQTACDHVFCEDCLKQWIQRPQQGQAAAAAMPPSAAGWSSVSPNALANAVCPMDRLPLTLHSLRPLKASNPLAYKILGRIEIGCPRHKHQGCVWRGEYSSGEDHVEKYCEYGLAPCVHCETHMQRRHLAHHVAEACPSRPVACEFCNQQLECNKVAAHVRESCTDVMVRCVGGPHSFALVLPSASGAAESSPSPEVIDGCGATMPRHRFQQHVSRECTKARVSCPLACHGCSAMLERSTVADHMAAQATAHLLLVSSRLDEETRRRQALEMQLEGLVGVLQEFAQQAAAVSSGAGGGAFMPASPLNGAASCAVPRRAGAPAANKSIFAGLTGALHAFKQAQGREAQAMGAGAGSNSASPPRANQQPQQAAAAGPAASSSVSSAAAASSPAAAAAPNAAASSSSSALRVSRSLSPTSPLSSPSDHELLSWPAPASISCASPSAHLSALDLSVGAKLDVRDSKGKWLEAEVLQLRRGAAGAGAPGSGFEQHIFIHFSNWSDKWDEWIDLSLEPGRVAPFNSFSRASSSAGMVAQTMRNAGGGASSSGSGASRCFVLHSSVAVYYFSPRPRGWARGSVWKVDGEQVSVRYAVAGAHYQRWFHAASDEMVQIPAAAPGEGGGDEGGEPAAAAVAGREAMSPNAVAAASASPSAAAAAPASRIAWTQRSSAQSAARVSGGSNQRVFR